MELTIIILWLIVLMILHILIEDFIAMKYMLEQKINELKLEDGKQVANEYIGNEKYMLSNNAQEQVNNHENMEQELLNYLYGSERDNEMRDMYTDNSMEFNKDNTNFPKPQKQTNIVSERVNVREINSGKFGNTETYNTYNNLDNYDKI